MTVVLRIEPGFEMEHEIAVPGRAIIMPMQFADDSMRDFVFELASWRGADGAPIYVLRQITETMPPITPQADYLKSGDNTRLPMMDQFGVSAHLEAAQRRREWADINGDVDGVPV